MQYRPVFLGPLAAAIYRVAVGGDEVQQEKTIRPSFSLQGAIRWFCLTFREALRSSEWPVPSAPTGPRRDNVPGRFCCELCASLWPPLKCGPSCGCSILGDKARRQAAWPNGRALTSGSRRPGCISISAWSCCDNLGRSFLSLHFLYGGPQSHLEQVEQSDSKCPRASSISITCELVRKATFGPQPQIRSPGVGGLHVWSDRIKVICMHVEV